MGKRPLSVTIISLLLIATALAGVAFHWTELKAAFQAGEVGSQSHSSSEILLITLLRAVAALCGIFMLRGSKWARWLAMVWIGCHVVIGALNSIPQLAIHVLVFVVFILCLFHSGANQYFRSSGTAS